MTIPDERADVMDDRLQQLVGPTALAEFEVRAPAGACTGSALSPLGARRLHVSFSSVQMCNSRRFRRPTDWLHRLL